MTVYSVFQNSNQIEQVTRWNFKPQNGSFNINLITSLVQPTSSYLKCLVIWLIERYSKSNKPFINHSILVWTRPGGGRPPRAAQQALGRPAGRGSLESPAD